MKTLAILLVATLLVAFTTAKPAEDAPHQAQFNLQENMPQPEENIQEEAVMNEARMVNGKLCAPPQC